MNLTESSVEDASLNWFREPGCSLFPRLLSGRFRSPGAVPAAYLCKTRKQSQGAVSSELAEAKP